MALSKQRKAYVAILLAAAGALLADRVILGTGATAPAVAAAEGLSVTTGTVQQTARPTAVGRQAEDLAAGASSLAGRIERLRDAAVDPGSEPVQADGPFASAVRDEVAGTIEQGSEPQILGQRADEYSRAHRLTAVMRSAAEASAVIAGRIYRIGDTLDGFVLIEVDRRSATFVGDGGVRVTLQVGTMESK